MILELSSPGINRTKFYILGKKNLGEVSQPTYSSVLGVFVVVQGTDGSVEDTTTR